MEAQLQNKSREVLSFSNVRQYGRYGWYRILVINCFLIQFPEVNNETFLPMTFFVETLLIKNPNWVYCKATGIALLFLEVA